MKKIYSIFILLFPGLTFASDYRKGGTEINLINSNVQSTTIEFRPGSFTFKKVSTPKGDANTLILDRATAMLEQGSPDLLKLTQSVIIPNNGQMKVELLSSNYYDLQNIDIAPSKGNLKRNIDPANVPFTYNANYQQNSFFPSAIVQLRDPYIMRDFRGQTILASPFQYNPVSRTLRVYTSITVKISLEKNKGGVNELERGIEQTPIDVEFDALYKKQFINYSNSNINKVNAYTPLAENGSMLVICYDAFNADMQAFVKWKNQKGIATELVNKATAGSTAAAIKTYITNYYNSHPTLKYVLLIGDAAQIPSSKTSSGDSDNHYGFLTGNDSYPEIFVGRFSATTSAQVQTMVARAISYEKTPQLNGTWYKNGITIGSAEGPGDNNEYDWQHQRIIRNKLLAYKYNNSSTYTNVTENFDGSQGVADASGNPTASMIATQVNNGAGIITYTGHGGDNDFVTTGFSVNNINALTNTNKWPFIYAVACVNGNFVQNATCFAEAWLRAGTAAAPKGAIATFMSTINQSWDPPMKAQDVMIDILTENVSGNIKRTFSGIAMNGCSAMIDAYGAQGVEIADTWTTFGDPSTNIFTNTPSQLTATHITTSAIGLSTVTVNCNTNGALVCLSINGAILGTGTVANGVATITFNAVNTSGTVIDVVATAYNMAPYSGIITLNGSVGINENTFNNQLNVYPVPTQNYLNVSIQLSQPEKAVQLSIFNSLGQEVINVFTKDLVNSNYNEVIDVSKLNAGVYICKLQIGNQILSKRIVINSH